MKEMMQAAVFEKKGLLVLKEMPIPELKASDDVLIKVDACSICGTDTRALIDPPEFIYPEGIIIGHEYTGVVQSLGSSVSTVKVGDKVVVHPNLWCGKCYYCKIGLTNLCINIVNIGCSVDGGMAEYSCVPEKLVYKIDKNVPTHIACLAEPLACVLNGTKSTNVKPGDNVIVLGAGPIGLIFALIFKAAGAKVIISDISDDKNEFALSLGIDKAFNPQNVNLVEEIMKDTQVGVDIVVDAVGILLSEAIKLARKGGEIILFGLNEKGSGQIDQAKIVFDELTIKGTYIAKGTFPLAIKMLEEGCIPIGNIISHRLPFEKVREGIDIMQSGEGVKVIIEIK